jgi:hypothetical protein
MSTISADRTHTNLHPWMRCTRLDPFNMFNMHLRLKKFFLRIHLIQYGQYFKAFKLPSECVVLEHLYPNSSTLLKFLFITTHLTL